MSSKGKDFPSFFWLREETKEHDAKVFVYLMRTQGVMKLKLNCLLHMLLNLMWRSWGVSLAKLILGLQVKTLFSCTLLSPNSGTAHRMVILLSPNANSHEAQKSLGTKNA